MCYGLFHSQGGSCLACKVARSCKRENLKRIRSDKERVCVQKIKGNTLDRFSIKESKKMLYGFLTQYMLPVSTYRLTKDFKRNYNINVSDNTIRKICMDMKNEGTINFITDGIVRKWFIAKI